MAARPCFWLPTMSIQPTAALRGSTARTCADSLSKHRHDPLNAPAWLTPNGRRPYYPFPPRAGHGVFIFSDTETIRKVCKIHLCVLTYSKKTLNAEKSSQQPTSTHTRTSNVLEVHNAKQRCRCMTGDADVEARQRTLGRGGRYFSLYTCKAK